MWRIAGCSSNWWHRVQRFCRYRNQRRLGGHHRHSPAHSHKTNSKLRIRICLSIGMPVCRFCCLGHHYYNHRFSLDAGSAVNPRSRPVATLPVPEAARNCFPGVTPNPALRHVNLSIGEPKHATPQLVIDALNANMAGLAAYPTTQGSDALRQSIGQWLAKRYAIPAPDAAKQIVPVNGSRRRCLPLPRR